MIKVYRLCGSLVLLAIVLAACAPQAGPAGDETGQQPEARSEDGLPTPTLSPINLAGPEMAVGSKFLYVDGSTLVAVPAGIFTMGREGGIDNPEHQVNLSEFWIYRTEVTNGQYGFCVAQGLCTPPSAVDNPGFVDPLKAAEAVTGVTWQQAEAYCNFVHARLPTEAEWEKAARGPEGDIYPWGDAAPSCALLNFNNCVGKITNVTLYPQGQSYYQALDMSGNAYEWVADRYHADYYLGAPADNPLGPQAGEQRSVRSSAYDSGGNQTPVFSRFFNRPEDHRSNLGFRCVVEDPAYFAPFCNYPAVYGTDGVGGPASGEQIDVDCPELSISQGPGCEGTKPLSNVTFSGPADAIVSVPEPACSALDSPGSTTCTDDGQLRICSECTVTTTSQPQCPDGYTYDSESQTCVGYLGPGACLPGFLISTQLVRDGVLTENTPPADGSVNQCCSLQPLDDLGLHRAEDVFPFCPAGTFFDGQECISVGVISPYCKVEGIALDSEACQPGGGGPGGNACNITCGSCQIVNLTNCSCMPDPNC